MDSMDETSANDCKLGRTKRFQLVAATSSKKQVISTHGNLHVDSIDVMVFLSFFFLLWDRPFMGCIRTVYYQKWETFVFFKVY